jgi:ABC-type multidrug transport system ATPase subunit
MWDELTVDEHLHIWNEIKFSMQDKAELDFLVEACDLTPKKSARANTLSGGQKRKLQLACTFVGASSVCLLDEVTSGLVSLEAELFYNL